MNYGSSKSAEIVLSKSIFYFKNQRNFFKKKIIRGHQFGGTCLVPPDLYEFGPTKTCEIGPTGLLKNVLFSKTSEFGPTDFFLDPNLLPLSIY